MEIKPTYVTFEQAKLIRKKGFNLKTTWAYQSSNPKNKYSYKVNHEILLRDKKDVFCPEQWELVEYLRINHGIWIEILLTEDSPYNNFYFRIMEIGKYFTLSHDGIYRNTPQEAYSAAFDYILKELI